MSEAQDLEWGRRKRVLAWVHFSIQIVALVALLLMANLLARKFPARADLTSRRTYALSTMAEDLLRNLKYDVEIWMNTEAYATSGDKALPGAVRRTQEVLEEFHRRSNHVKWHVLTDQNTPGIDVFRANWSAISPATLFILAKLEKGLTNKREIGIQELYEGNALTGDLTVYKGEPMLVQAIRDLGGSNKRIVYESEGHRETLTADTRRMSTLANFLKLNEGVEFRRLPINEYKTIPIDCDLLMIMAPEQPFLEHELEAIKEYLERGGSLLVAIRARVRTGLEKLLEEYSIKVGDNVVCDPQQAKPPFITDLWLADFNVHAVNRNMANVMFQMPQSCTVDPIPRKDNNWIITPLAMAGPASWEEKGGTGPGDNPKPDADERVGNMKVIVAVEKTASHPMDDHHKTAKIDVWGSASPFTNAQLRDPYVFQGVQGQYVVNHFRWLMERELLEIEPKKFVVKPLDMTGPALDRLFWTVMVGFPSFGVALGLLAWFLRRK
jgi:hypothetical protein